jgi:dolichol kinase
VNVAAAAVALTAFQAAVELFKRRAAVPRELARKIVHIGSGVLSAPLAYILSDGEIVVLASLFVVAMAVSRRVHLLTAVHDVDRESYGELLFPLGVAILAALHPEAWEFAYALLVLALADGAAALAGMRFGRRKLPVGGKSIVGSLTFFAVAFGVGLFFAPLGPCVLVAFAATIAESLLTRGFDNVVLPVLAGVLIGIL